MNTELIAPILAYAAGMSLVLFILMGVDKRKAVKHARRIPERTLMWFAALGGALGGVIGMYAFRHKTQKPAFKAGFPLLVILNAALGALVMYLLR